MQDQPIHDQPIYDVARIREDFPILGREVNGVPLVYLDNGASAQKPQAVIDAVTAGYGQEYANVHRGLHFLSNLATEKFEAVRGKVAAFLGVRDPDEIVFTSGSTMGINLVAYGWAMPRIEPGDEVVLSVMEHHSNIVPWHFLRERRGAVLKWVPVDGNGDLDPQAMIDAMGPRTKVVALTHMSNVLGTLVDVKPVIDAARERGIVSVIDGSQAAVHTALDLDRLAPDFYAITGHKLYGPSGSGALYARRERQEEMQPFHGGGDMIREVHEDRVLYNDGPLKFEAGTPAIVETIGFGAALDYLGRIGMERIAAHEADLRDYALGRFEGLNWLTIHGRAKDRGAIFSMEVQGGAHAHDISTVLDRKGIAVRAGHHCAQPLMDHLGITATARASFGLYNTREEVDRLVEGLELCHEFFG